MAGLALAVALGGCASAAGPTAAVPPADDALADAVARHGCEFLEDHFLALVDDAGVSSGRAWVQRCDASREVGGMHVRATVLGWQWLERRASGFDVREYVYFRARVDAHARGHLAAQAGRPVVSFQTRESDVTVEEIGRVSARPATLASRLIGAAASIFGSGPNSVATSSMRSEVENVLRAHLAGGASWSLDEVQGGSSFLDERQALYPGGALLSGPMRAGDAALLHFEVDGERAVLARAVCLNEVKGIVESVIDGAPTSVAPPIDTRTLRGRGTLHLDAMPCPWVLVTGTSDDREARVHVSLERDRPPPRCGERACMVRLTLGAFDVARLKEDGTSWDPDGGAPDVAFVLEAAGRTLALGPVFPDTPVGEPWLTSPPFELPAGAPFTLRAFDVDPLPSTLLEPQRSTRELLGVATAKPEELMGGIEQTVPLRAEGKERGFVRVRLEVVAAP
jgi:hypothetical protein